MVQIFNVIEYVRNFAGVIRRRLEFFKLFFITTSLIIIGTEIDWLPSKQGGFFCNDPKLSFKYQGDTVSNTLLLGTTIFAPLFFFFICEMVAFIPDLYQTSSPSRRLQVSFKRTIYRYREYLIGFGILILIVEVVKGSFGEPRPHFLDTCKPDKAIGCTNDSTYIESYTCTNTEGSSTVVKDSHKSFPSGHSAISAYTGLFFIWYMEKRFPKRLDSWLIKPLLQVIFFLWSFVVPITRITDHRHHWWDAMAGSILGIVCLTYTVRTFCDNFDNPEYKSHGKNHQSIKRLISTASEAPRTDKELTNVNSYK